MNIYQTHFNKHCGPRRRDELVVGQPDIILHKIKKEIHKYILIYYVLFIKCAVHASYVYIYSIHMRIDQTYVDQHCGPRRHHELVVRAGHVSPGVCVCVYIYIYTYIHTHTHIYIHTYTHTHTHTHTYIYIYIHTYTHTYIYTYTHTHTHTHIYIYIIYIYIHIYRER